MVRPGLQVGELYVQDAVPSELSSLENRREYMSKVERPGKETYGILDREVNFDRGVALDTELFGPKIQLADKTIAGISGSTNKQLTDLQSSIDSGNVQSVGERRKLFDVLIKLIKTSIKQQKMTMGEFQNIQQSLSKLRIPTDYIGYFGVGHPRIVGKEWIESKDNDGDLAMYLMNASRISKISPNLQGLKVAWNMDPTARATEVNLATLITMVKRTDENQKWFDLDRRCIISSGQIKALIEAGKLTAADFKALSVADREIIIDQTSEMYPDPRDGYTQKVR
jgi:hypothetical protein